MSTSAPRKIIKSLSTLAAALFLLSTSAMAQEQRSSPVGLYGGATFGIGVSQWECGTTCDRATFSGKLFGGKRLTPGLAAEVNYMFFGGLNAANDTAITKQTGVAAVRQKARALTLGINWEVELLDNFTNHIRLGWAYVRKDDKLTLANGREERKTNNDMAPYLGVGLSLEVYRGLRLVNGLDYIVNGKESYYLFSVGGSAEF
jgi:hypothetical protein